MIPGGSSSLIVIVLLGGPDAPPKFPMITNCSSPSGLESSIIGISNRNFRHISRQDHGIPEYGSVVIGLDPRCRPLNGIVYETATVALASASVPAVIPNVTATGPSPSFTVYESGPIKSTVTDHCL